MNKTFQAWIDAANEMGAYKETIVERVIEDDAEYWAMNIETELLPGEWTKTYLWLGFPKHASANPAVMHIHGGGFQTVNLDHVKHWVHKGYVALSYDWKEEISGQERHSDLANMPRLDMEDEYAPLQSVMLTRVLHAKKMITWLSLRQEVDPNRIGVFGISRGGSITWILNAWDDRLKAAVPIYGCGKHLAPGRLNRNIRKAHSLEDTREWNRLLDGVTLASRQQSPVLLMTATNDYWGWLDAICEAAVQIPPAQRGLYIAANQNHQLDHWAGNSLDRWMDVHVKGEGAWPQAPRVTFNSSTENGFDNLHATATLDTSVQLPDKLRFCWSWWDFSEVLPPGRYWHVVEIDVSDNPSIVIPVIDPRISGYLYIDAVYADGVKASSFPVRFSPAYIGVKHTEPQRSHVLADFSNGLDGWCCPYMRTEPYDVDFEYVILSHPDGGKALSMNEPELLFSLATNKLVDPSMASLTDEYMLHLQLFNELPGRWIITLFYRPDQAGELSWTSELRVITGWSETQIARTAFHNEDGHILPYWAKAQRIVLTFYGLSDQDDAGRAAVGKILFDLEIKMN
ncbi:alpha/beta hydrolase family protein [Paenibacillus roseipurpureus]|uniref:Acetylxylan esterase n=1 Tax=Paenibacillus roseopurpureus TaxID=2918901 RepID=A0AA96LT16_9BACL|nr:acetylxylan esterase [Paenibacillus sp. MBLB1832]WNR45418.1 acetylxylan esterase [Paenibacillus sp. MBLB1832]